MNSLQNLEISSNLVERCPMWDSFFPSVDRLPRERALRGVVRPGSAGRARTITMAVTRGTLSTRALLELAESMNSRVGRVADHVLLDS